jgi:serine/threonine-protein kinase
MLNDCLLKIFSIDIFELMKKLFENPISKKIIIGLGIFIVLILVVDNIIFPWYVSSPESFVPSVIGMSEHDAVSTLKDAEFEPVISDTSYGVDFPDGNIFLQKPAAGKTVKKGRTIYLFISGGEQSVYVPMLKGKTVLDARFALERLGLRLGKIDEVASTQPKDMIFDQQYAEGTKLKKGEIVGVSVSVGKGFGSIEVPDLIGKSLSEAKIILADSSLVLGKVNYQISNTLLPNTVLDQYPAPGNKLNTGDAVDLFITKEGVLPDRSETHPEN